MNRRTVIVAPVLVGALAIGATACGSDPTPTPHYTYTPTYTPTTSTYTTDTSGGDYATWVNTVDGLCQEERVAWSSGLATAMSGLLAVQFKPGFTPVPDDSRATDFASALASLKTADENYAAVQSNIITRQDAYDILLSAKTEAKRAAASLNASDCIAMATA